ncbi:hypothetical protein ACFVS2_22240 [Brevibacillus sp. NPDC058079]|uniref:hypothetical protein n=1 Tax=Brevibacillus sp. NPDC058079 TaxID=3346330 RepID=UPI0036E6B9D6
MIIDVKRNTQNKSSYVMTSFLLGFSVLLLLATWHFLTLVVFGESSYSVRQEYVKWSYFHSSLSQFTIMIEKIRSYWNCTIFVGVLVVALISILKACKGIVLWGRLFWSNAFFIILYSFVQILARIADWSTTYLVTFNINEFQFMNLLADVKPNLFQVIYGIVVVVLVGVGIMKLFRFITIIMMAFAFPFAYSLGMISGHFVWKTCMREGGWFLIDVGMGVGLTITLLLSLMNQWNPIIIFVMLLVIDLLSSFLHEISEAPAFEKSKSMEGDSVYE